MDEGEAKAAKRAKRGQATSSASSAHQVHVLHVQCASILYSGPNLKAQLYISGGGRGPLCGSQHQHAQTGGAQRWAAQHLP